MNNLSFLGRKRSLFDDDITFHEKELNKIVSKSSFLVIGAAGTIGQAVTKEIFKRNPKKLHALDISENNLVELVRDIRSSLGYIDGEFRTFVIDIGSKLYDNFIYSDGKYDYVLNLSALKHVRSERDQFSLMRMVNVNILNTYKTLNQSIKFNTKKYFSVSSDKAANPANLMGASKKIMEMFLLHKSEKVEISTARFANVAFSDGSLLNGFQNRIYKKQPIVAPYDIKRYFITPQESGQLCLMSCILGKNRDILFPKLNSELNQTTFSEIAVKFLNQNGFEVFECKSETEARRLINTLPNRGIWPCYFTKTDTEGEKYVEEFFTNHEVLDLEKFKNIGIIKNQYKDDNNRIKLFLNELDNLQNSQIWSKKDIIELFKILIPDFNYISKNKNLDSKM